MDPITCSSSKVDVTIDTTLIKDGRSKRVHWSSLKPVSKQSALNSAQWAGRTGLLEVEASMASEAELDASLAVTCRTRTDWRLGGCCFKVRVKTSMQHAITWPYAGGAVVPVRQLCETGRTLELTYPVYASMQWVDCFHAERGIYIAAHDDQPYFKHLRASAVKAGRAAVVSLEFDYTDLDWPAGRMWVSPPLIVQPHEGDWRSGGAFYRTWADQWFRHEQPSEAVRRTPGHNMISFPTGGGRVPFKSLPELAEASRKLGIDGVHVADWMQPGFDTHYPEFEPDDALGGEGGLARALQKMERAGTWTCLYLNGRLLDPAGPFGRHALDWGVKLPDRVKQRFKQMWQRTQDRSLPGWDPEMAMPTTPAPETEDGTIAQEWWGRVLDVMCPSVRRWQDLWLARVTRVADRMKPLMFQVDQVCGCWGMPCYDHRHPHQSPALAWSWYKTFTWRMRRCIQKNGSEDVGLWTEGVNDMLGQAFDGLQMNLGFRSLLAGLGEWDPRIFKSTFPEYLYVSGDLDGQDLKALAWAIVTGAHYHFFLQDVASLSSDLKRWVRYATRIRSKHWKLLTLSDVFVPAVGKCDALRVMGYRADRRMLITGCTLGAGSEVDDAFDAVIELPEACRLRKCDWLMDDQKTRCSIKGRQYRIRGRGPFTAEFVC